MSTTQPDAMNTERLRAQAKELFEQGLRAEARDLLRQHQGLIEQDKTLLALAQLLGPLREPAQTDESSDFAQIMRWIKQHGRSERYANKWVALIGDRVLAEGDTYAALIKQLEGHPERAQATLWGS